MSDGDESRAEPSVRVSVVTVVRNGCRHIDEAIASVLSQDYEPVEFVIIDGGSTDGTVDIIRRHDAELAYWVSEPDEGIFDAWNKGIRKATGDLIKLLNADDRLSAGSIRRAVEAYENADRKEMVIASDVTLIDEYGSALKVLNPTRSLNPVGAVLHPSWFVDRRVYDRVGLYETHYRISADFEMYLRLHREGVPFVFTSGSLADFRTGGVSNQGVGGLRESYSIARQYLPLRDALRMALRSAFRKLRLAAALRLLGEERTYRLQATMRHLAHRSV